MSTTPETYTTRTFSFACQIVDLYRSLNQIPHFPFAISRQLLRSGTAIGAIIKEARVFTTRKDLASKFVLGLRETRETKYWLRLIIATKLAPAALLNDALREADELTAILHTTVQRLRAE